MKVFYMGVIRNDSRPALQLCAEKDLTSFNRFYRGTVGEYVEFYSLTVAERTQPKHKAEHKSVAIDPSGKPVEDLSDQSVAGPEKVYIFHVFARPEGVAGVMATEREYPLRVAHGFLRKLLDEFLAKYPHTVFSDPSLRANACPLPQLKEYIVTYQKPEEADVLEGITQQLKQVHDVLTEDIGMVLQRGESLSVLADKSDAISAQAKMFVGQAKAQNSSCCVVM